MKFNKTAVSLVIGGAVLATVASIGGATAGALITGKDIKDGTVRKADLSTRVNARLDASGAEGPAGPAGADGANGKDGLAGAVYRTATYLNGGAGDATVACADDNAVSQTYTAIAGGVQAGDADAVTGTPNEFDVSSSFPGRMDWNTGEPKADRLDGWIVLGSGGWTDTLVVWALCVPNTTIAVQNTNIDN